MLEDYLSSSSWYIKCSELSTDWFSPSNIFNVRSKFLEINRYVEMLDGSPKIKTYCDGWWEKLYTRKGLFAGWKRVGEEFGWPLFRVFFCKEILYLLDSKLRKPIHSNKPEDFYTAEAVKIIHIKKIKLIKILKEFCNFHSETKFLDRFLNPAARIPGDANLKLPALISALKDSVLALCEINADRKILNDSFIFNKKNFENLSLYSKSLVKKLSVCYEKHISRLRPNADDLAIYKNWIPTFIAELEFFNCWFDPAAVISLYGFELRLLKAVQKDWDSISDSMKTFYFWGLMMWKIEPAVQGYLALYHHNIEISLRQLRVAASQAQIEQATLREQLLGMEKCLAEIDIDDIELQSQIMVAMHQSKQDMLYQQALNQIAAVCKYNKNLQIELKKVSNTSVFKIITELSDIKTIKKPIRVALSEKKEQKKLYSELSHPISIHLLDLETLKALNQGAEALLAVIKQTSFWKTQKKEFRTRLVFLIENFNNCFKIEPLTEEDSLKKLEEGNICLQDLMVYIQYLPDLAYMVELVFYIVQDEHDIRTQLESFILLYGQKMRESLAVIQRQYLEIEASSLKLRNKIQVLENKIKNERKIKLEFKKAAHQEQPYKEALLKIAEMILITEINDSSSSIIPFLMMILKYSYEGLDNRNTVEQKAKPPNLKLTTHISSFEQLPPIRENWKFLKLIYQYSNIMENKYTGYNPADNWSLWWTGVTDRLGSETDRQAQYINFCDRFRPLLSAFNQNFLDHPSSFAEDKVIVKANAELLQLENAIENSITNGDGDELSYSFYRLYQDENKKHKNNQENKPFLSWESLKNLNQSSQMFVEIKIWKDVRYGRLTSDSLILGAIKLFKNQFTQEALRDNKDADKTFSANQSLLCLMQIIYNYFTCFACIPDEKLFQLSPFIIQYNRYVQARIEQLYVNIHRKAFSNQMLRKKLADLQGCKTFDHQARSWLRSRIQEMVRIELNNESICMQVLLQISQLVISQTEPVFVKIGTLIQDVKQSAPNTRTQKEDQGQALLPGAGIKENTLLSEQFLHSFSEKVNSLLSDLSHHSDSKQEPIANFIGLIQDFSHQISTDLSRADDVLQTLVREISHCIYLHHYNESVSWPLYCFLVNYSSLITRYLQYLWSTDDEYNRLATQLTAQIDQLQQKRTDQLDLQALIQDLIESEQTVDKSHRQMIRIIAHTIFESGSKMNSQQFSALKPVLKSIFSIFS